MLSLPLTTNTMHPQQRARLLRTARKLEALLGATPQVLDPAYSDSASSEPSPIHPTQPLISPVVMRPPRVSHTHHRAHPLVTPSERRKLKVDSVLGPLSPVNILHFPNEDEFDFSSRPSSPPPTDGLSDKEKRIKLAKLQRLMGENIPPQLVFKERYTHRNSVSMSVPRTIQQQPVNKGKAKQVRPLPSPPSVIRKPSRSLPNPPVTNSQAPLITQTTSQSTSSSFIHHHVPKPRKQRPRSLTLGASSAIVSANLRLAQQQQQEAVVKNSEKRGTLSLDEGRRQYVVGKEKGKSDEGDVFWGLLPDAPFVQKRTSNLASEFKAGIWKRKEKEWSGEWNLKDMDEVTRTLRDLRAS